MITNSKSDSEVIFFYKKFKELILLEKKKVFEILIFLFSIKKGGSNYFTHMDVLYGKEKNSNYSFKNFFLVLWRVVIMIDSI